MDLYKHFNRTRMVVWIRISADPHAKARGFSIENRELRVKGYEPIFGTMEDFRGSTMPGKFWVVEASEVYRVIPEMRKFPIREEAWFFPFEFCDSFVRPDYYLSTKIVHHEL
jgi:hypothetical protein